MPGCLRVWSLLSLCVYLGWVTRAGRMFFLRRRGARLPTVFICPDSYLAPLLSSSHVPLPHLSSVGACVFAVSINLRGRYLSSYARVLVARRSPPVCAEPLDCCSCVTSQLSETFFLDIVDIRTISNFSIAVNLFFYPGFRWIGLPRKPNLAGCCYCGHGTYRTYVHRHSHRGLVVTKLLLVCICAHRLWLFGSVSLLIC